MEAAARDGAIDIAIIGSGVAGLAAARRLADAGRSPVVFDKGRGIGGRVATRRGGGFQFDHGAQYVTARGRDFAACLAELCARDAAAPWIGEGRGDRIVGLPGMSALAKAMGRGLDIRQGAEVVSVRHDGSGWHLGLATDAGHRADHVILAMPAPQALRLIGADHPLSAELAGVAYEPCLTLMAAIDAPPPFDSRLDPDDALPWIAQDSAKPGRPRDGIPTWVAQAAPGLSGANLDLDPEGIAALLLPMLCDRLGVAADRVRHAVGHRWRLARVTTPLGQTSLASTCGTLHLAGDWCLGPRVEDAWTSGRAAADALLGTRA